MGCGFRCGSEWDVDPDADQDGMWIQMRIRMGCGSRCGSRWDVNLNADQDGIWT